MVRDKNIVDNVDRKVLKSFIHAECMSVERISKIVYVVRLGVGLYKVRTHVL